MASRLSYSAVNQYEECPRAFQHARLEGRPRTTAWWNVGGSAVHRGIEIYETDVDRSPAARRRAGIEAFREFLADSISDDPHGGERWRAANKGAEGHEFWIDAGPRFIDNYLRTRDPEWQLLGSEVRFEFKVAGVSMLGFIDQIFRISTARATYCVVDDLKSGKPPSDPTQLHFYAIAARRTDPGMAPIRSTRVDHVRSGRIIDKGYPESGFYERYARRVLAVDMGVSDGLFPPKPSWKCGFCPFWDLCQGVGKPKA